MIYVTKTIYSLFVFQFIFVVILATMNIGWHNNYGIYAGYLEDCEYKNFGDWFVAFLVHYINVSHLVPISLYVVIEIMKLILTF
jgi:magnesium-transporting ATPase (P-type)